MKDLEFIFSYPLLDHRQSQKPLTDAVCALLYGGQKTERTHRNPHLLPSKHLYIENRSLNQKFNNKEVIRTMWCRKKIYQMTLAGVIIISVLSKDPLILVMNIILDLMVVNKELPNL